MVKRFRIPNIELIRFFLGLITLGKSVFEAVEPVRTDPFFKSAMGIKQASTSLQEDVSCGFLTPVQVPVSALEIGREALDINVCPIESSRASKERVSYTYKGC